MAPVDPTPFVPFLPPAVAATFLEAGAGRGVVAGWLEARAGSQAATVLGWLGGEGASAHSGSEGALPAETLGWIAGMTSFGEDPEGIALALRVALSPAVAPFAVADRLAESLIATHRPRPARGYATPGLVAEASRDGRENVDTAALLDAVYKDPGDLERRLVLADALLQNDDPRGELIMLQTADNRQETIVKQRIQALFEQHLDAWIGPLPTVDRATARFEAGFLRAAEIAPSAGMLEASLGRPEWRTVERLRIDTRRLPSAEPVAALLENMVSLRVLALTSLRCERIGRELCAGPGSFPRIRTLGCRAALLDDPLRAFPSVRLLAINGHLVSPVEAIDRAATNGIAALLVIGLPSLEDALAAFARGPLAELRLVARPDPHEWPEHSGWALRLVRDRALVELSGNDRSYRGDLPPILSSLAGRPLAIRLPRLGRAAARAAIDDAGPREVTFVEEPLDEGSA